MLSSAVPDGRAVPPENAFDHLLLTRYNVSLRCESETAHIGLDEQWLAHRMELFERYCFPSVASQSNKAFTWIVLLDPRTPRLASDALDRLAERCQQLTVLKMRAWNDTAKRAIVQRFTRAPYVISSRLDNDDAISVDFIEHVQAAFHPSALEFINFPSVAVYDVSTRRFYTRKYLSNPFISLIEARNDDAKTVFGFGDHTKINGRFLVRQIYTKRPMALTVVHGRNIRSKIRGWPAFAAQVAPGFLIPWDGTRGEAGWKERAQGLKHAAWAMVALAGHLVGHGPEAAGRGGPRRDQPADPR